MFTYKNWPLREVGKWLYGNNYISTFTFAHISPSSNNKRKTYTPMWLLNIFKKNFNKCRCEKYRKNQDTFQSDPTNRSNEPPRNQQLRLFSQTFQASQGLIRSIGRVKHRLESVVYQTHRLVLFPGPCISNQQIPTKCKGISEKFRWNESKSWRWNSTTFHTEFKSYTCFFQGHFSFSSWRGDEWWNQLITCPPPLWIKFASSMFMSFFVLKLRSFCFFATSEWIAIWKKTLRSVSGLFFEDIWDRY